ncbi:related to FMO1 - flavin-containing monooxygenase [Ustilago trichophora]|uniref:Related to FMO1 - flavin-containing monooxygenase n=1 Tax=Ustilago trichophora TaxID=86804 RepID=A0A5C3DR12_9BASI|nr:related to FMO1 - flavin-containing monooxygenase [Ustilago trichophora]
MSTPRRVAIIGAGPSGLSAVSQFLSLNTFSSTRLFDVTLFDRRATFGGVWNYDASPGGCVVRFDGSGRPHALWENGWKDGDDRGRFVPPGAMYDGLRTNLPCDIMAYRSQPYNSSTDLFPDRATVERYIKSFAETVVGESSNMDLRLGTAVIGVKRISHHVTQAKKRFGWGSVWNVTSINIDSKKQVKEQEQQEDKEEEEEYDHVVIASGRCNTPSIPTVEGLALFQGEILHSAWWRSPLPFEGKTVLVVGNSSSGSDIARELAGYVLRTLPEGSTATEEYIQRRKISQVKVLHSYEQYDKPPPLDYDPRDENSPAWAKRIQVVPKVSKVEKVEGGKGSRIRFEDGQEREDVDVIIFATGYAYDLPYLDQSLSPFSESPLIPSRPTTTASTAYPLQAQDEVYTPSFPTSSHLTNLDDWSLFYSSDASLCVLGAPIRIVPMPLTHVQSRIVASAWSGHLSPSPDSTGLPRLDPNIPTTDPAKWTSRRPTADNQAADRMQNPNKTADLGYPSDSAYQEALLQLLPHHLSISGADEHLKVPPAHQVDNAMTGVLEESLKPVVAADEGWARMADYRNQRRSDTKRLRRLLLGY